MRRKSLSKRLRFAALSREFSLDALTQAITITARKHGRRDEAWGYSPRHAIKVQKYFHGILRNWREGKFL